MEGHTDGGVVAQSDNKWFIAVLVVLCAAIVGLIIAIIITTTNQNQAPKPDEANATEPYVLYEEEQNYDYIPTNLISELRSVNSVKDRITLWQECIDNVVDSMELAELYRQRANDITAYDIDKEYGDIAIGDAIASDDILQTIDSAVWVHNIAANYSREDIANEYLLIMEERMGGADLQSVDAEGRE